MDDIVVIKDLTFHYRQKKLFDRLNLNIKKGSITTIIGPNGSGKSTLVRILLGLYRFNGYVTIGEDALSKQSVKKIRRRIGVVFENPDNQFVAETVMDDIAFTLENMYYKRKIIFQKIEEISRYLGIEKLMERNPHELSGGEKQLVALASALVHDPDILIFDEAFTMIDPIQKDNVYKILKDLNKTKHITIINITHDMEETLFSDEIIVLDSGQVVLQGNKDKVFNEEKKFTDLKLDLPFIVKLSHRLIFYGLIDHLVYDMEEMVDYLWK